MYIYICQYVYERIVVGTNGINTYKILINLGAYDLRDIVSTVKDITRKIKHNSILGICIVYDMMNLIHVCVL